MGDLKLGLLARDDGPVLLPVELEGFARHEGQRNESAAVADLLLALSGSRQRKHRASPTGRKPHAHWHRHAPIGHKHPHYPDLHHRHSLLADSS